MVERLAPSAKRSLRGAQLEVVQLPTMRNSSLPSLTEQIRQGTKHPQGGAEAYRLPRRRRWPTTAVASEEVVELSVKTWRDFAEAPLPWTHLTTTLQLWP